MPTVEWAEVRTVAHAAQSAREKPEQLGEVFAAVFDSARRSIGSRVDRTIREQQHRAADKKKPIGASDAQAVTSGQSKNKGSQGLEEPKKNERVAKPEPPAKQTTIESAQAECSQPGPAEDSPQADEPIVVEQATEPIAADLMPQVPPEPKSSPFQDSRDQNAVVEDLLRESMLGATQFPIDIASAETQVTDALVTQTSPQLVIWAVADPVAAIIPNMPATAEARDVPTGGSAAPQATEVSATREATGTSSTEQVPQPASGADVQPAQELSISVWQFIRGVAAHLEQAIESQDRTTGNKQPADRLQQTVAAQTTTDQTPPNPLTKALLADGLENGIATHRQSHRQNENHSPGQDATSQASSDDVAKSADGSVHQTGANDEFRGLLELAGRGRGRIVSSDLQPATPSFGRDLGGQGISLKEARAMTELADVVRANIGARHSSMVLKLEPPELGQLRVDVRTHGDELRLRLQADTLLGRDALQSRINELRSSLEQHGFKLSQIQVELRVPQTNPGEAHQDRPFQQQEHWDGQSSHDPAWQGHEGGGSPTSSGSEWSNEASAFSQENASSGEEQGRVDRLAETGVDLVV
ncbi:MAG: flagellar hook-length control protein FliK [Phycisphaerae bacterium]